MPASNSEGSQKFWHQGTPFGYIEKGETPGTQQFWYEGAPFPPLEPATASQTISGVSGITSAEAFGTGVVAGPIVGTAGIASAEAFGSTGGEVATVDQTLTGSGIASAEAFGAGVVAGPIVGTAGIASQEAFGSTGSQVSTGTLTGTSGIPSEEVFGADGTVGSIGGPIEGFTGIPSAEAFGVGVVAGPILGTSGIASAEAFGTTGGQVTVLLSGANGIPSEEAFGSNGRVNWGVAGLRGIPSEEAFGSTGTVILEQSNRVSIFRVYVRGVDLTDYIKASSISGARQTRMQGQASFVIQDEDDSLPFDIAIGQPVVIMAYRESDTTWVRLFGGLIDTYNIVPAPYTDLVEFSIVCSDYGSVLSRRVVQQSYPAADFGDDVAIIEDLASTILAEEGISFIDLGDAAVPVEDIDQSLSPVSDLVATLCGISGKEAQVDMYKNFYYSENPISSSPPGPIADDNAGTWFGIGANHTRGMYRNVEWVKASYAVEPQTVTIDYEIDLSTPDYLAVPFFISDSRYQPVQILSVKKNGTDLVVWGLGQTAPFGWHYKQGPAGYALDLTWNIENAIINPQAPVAGDIITVQFTVASELPPVTKLTNDVEIAARKALEGGSGKWEYVDELIDVSDPAVVNSFGQGNLDRYSQFGLEVNVGSFLIGYEPGQAVPVNVAKAKVNQTLVLESMAWREDSLIRLVSDLKLSNAIHRRDHLSSVERLIRNMRRPNRGNPVEFTFSLAVTLPGISSPGLEVGTNVTNEYIAPARVTLKEIDIYFKTGPVGADIILDIKVDGVSIFPTGYQLTYPEGSTSVQVYKVFKNSPQIIPKGSRVTIDVTQVGVDTPGRDGTVAVVGWA